jgi:hypothetical protein
MISRMRPEKFVGPVFLFFLCELDIARQALLYSLLMLQTNGERVLAGHLIASSVPSPVIRAPWPGWFTIVRADDPLLVGSPPLTNDAGQPVVGRKSATA